MSYSFWKVFIIYYLFIHYLLILIYYYRFIIFRNLRNKPFDINTKNLIRQIPYASSEEQVYDLLQKIKDTNDNGIEGINYLIKIIKIFYFLK